MADKIAIIGMSCLFPGAKTLDEFWQNLVQEMDATSLATAEQMGVDPERIFSDDKGKPDHLYNRRGGYIRDFDFNPAAYNIPNDFINSMDDLYKWSLYVAGEALIDSGYKDNTTVRSRTGVIMGNLSFPTRKSHRLVHPIYRKPTEQALQKLLKADQFNLVSVHGDDNVSLLNIAISDYPASVVAQTFGLGGVNFCLDAACASSLYAIRLAASYLLAGKADMMLAGAVSASDPSNNNVGFCLFRAMPGEDEQNTPLSKGSKGLIASQGAGMVVLKRHADAVRDGDHIYATILGGGLSNDGTGQHILAPKSGGQILAYERAYENARVQPETIQYVECHATGTPLGDVTELNSMQMFFGQEHGSIPAIGSVKSNLGHLLTAAGMAGVIKVILSMNRGIIPPTIKITEPLTPSSGDALHIVTEPTTWEGRGKRAGVSAFGFGGCNAHLVLGEADEDARPEYPAQDIKVAITGMDACFGEAKTLSDFERAIQDGRSLFRDVPENRWKGIEDETDLLREWGLPDGEAPQGAYIDGFDIDFRYFKTPPLPDDRVHPQQLLMLRVADSAIKDARLSKGGNVAVLIAMSSELSLHLFRTRYDLGWQIEDSLKRAGIDLTPEEEQELKDITRTSIHNWPQVNQYTSFIGNTIASRISALWDFSGPSFTISSGENSTYRALDVAQMMLAAGDVDAVVLGAVDLSAGVEHVVLRSRFGAVNQGNPTLSYDESVNGWNVGEGSGAIVLERQKDAHFHNKRVYAIIDASGMVQCLEEENAYPHPPSASAVQEAAWDAFQKAGVTPGDIGYLEVHGSGYPVQDAMEIEGLNAVYGSTANGQHSCAIGSVKASIGHTGVASGIASLIKTALILYRRIIPAVPNWTAPDSDLTETFYVPPYSRPWMVNAPLKKRVAAISSMGMDGAHVHVILSEDTEQTVSEDFHLQHSPYKLFPIPLSGPRDLEIMLPRLAEHIRNCDSLAQEATRAYEAYRRMPEAPSTLVLIGSTKEELLSELAAAERGVAKAFKKKQDWKSRLGSFFTAKPLGRKGRLAFVFPGAFNPYLDMAPDIMYWFPYLHRYFAGLSDNPGRIIGDHLLYPRSQRAITREDKRQYEERLRDDTASIMQAGISYSVIGSKIMREYLKLHPEGVFGYSIGETSMMWAMGIISDYDESYRLLDTSPLFKSRVVGRKEVVREYFGIPADAPDDSFWGNYFIAAPLEKVQALIKDEPRVFLDQINTPNKMHICGYPEDVERVIEKLGCHYVKSPFSNVLHNPAMAADYERFVRLNTLPINNDAPDVDIYTSATYEKIPRPLNSHLIGETIARSNCSQVDFPRLVNRVYDDGYRVFVELGARQTCTRWIKDILKGRDHTVMALDSPGTRFDLAVLRVVAQLLAHDVDMDISALYSEEPAFERRKISLIDTVVPGGKRIQETILSEKNMQRFAHLPVQSSRPVAETVSQKQPVQESSPVAVPTESRAVAPPATINEPERYMSYLDDQQQSLTTLRDQIEQQLEQVRQAAETAEAAAQVNTPPPADDAMSTYPLPVPRNKPEGVIWDEYDLLEFARSGIAGVFGEAYREIDRYPRRVRLPMPPYLLVSRITALDAQTNVYEPSSMTTEYDIPENAWYSVDGQVPWAVTTESGQCDLLLISYLGIDFENQGDRVYRLLDGTLIFKDELPKDGQKLRYDISISTFARSGENLLFFFQYDCYADDKLIMQMRDGCAGFFSDEELASGRGVIRKQQEIEARQQIQKQVWTPPRMPARTSLSKEDMLKLTEGDVAAVFGDSYDQNGRNKSLRLPPASIMMIDRITQMDVRGGLWGLGEVTGEKDLSPNDWYFTCHFKDDNVLAGSLMAEACGQLLQAYMLAIGLQDYTQDARFQPLYDVPQIVKCRGQVIPEHTLLTYRMEVTEVGYEPHPYIRANVEAWCDGKMVVLFTDLGLQLIEKDGGAAQIADRSGQADSGEIVVRKSDALFNEKHIEAFAMGRVADCFGEEYNIYDNRRASRTPNRELKLVSRIVEINGTRHDFSGTPDLLSEYDVPEHPWWYDDNAYPIEPYSILMEIGLQPCGFLSAYLGSCFIYSDRDLYFRNLDGTGDMLREVDLRGKTIQNRVVMLASTQFQGMIIQKFTYELSVDGEPFYRGTADFGYFTPEALANQLGLDSGRATTPWFQDHPEVETIHYDLTDPDWRAALYTAPEGKPHWRLSGNRLDLLEDVILANKDGNWAYIYARDAINPEDWFYSRHFYQDPVMPGSLGVEAILQAMQVYAIQTRLGDDFQNPHFEHVAPHKTTWKYRGQITRESEMMSLDIHIKEIRADERGLVIVGDASLWKQNLRIYEVLDIALGIREG